MLVDLANILGTMIETPEAIRDVLQDAGVQVQQVTLTGSPYQMWRSALEEAAHNELLPVLLSVVRGRYPGNSKLFQAELAYWQAQQKESRRSSPPQDGGVERRLYEITSQVAAINVRLMYIERSQAEQQDQPLNRDWLGTIGLIVITVLLTLFAARVLGPIQPLYNTPPLALFIGQMFYLPRPIEFLRAYA